jgi:Flp pilus assembly protein TadD
MSAGLVRPSARRRFRRLAIIVTASAICTSAGAVGFGIWRSQTANELVHSARARLEASFIEAPTIDRLQASTAISLLERARSLGRDDSEIRGLIDYAEAIEDFQRGDLVLAEGELATALTHLGPTADLHVLAAALSRGRLLHREARAEVDMALAIDSEHPRARFLAADLALDAGEGRQAREHFETLREREPRSAVVLNRLGLAREQMGDASGAEEAFRAATELEPLGHEPWINMGRLLRVARRHEEARHAFDEAITRAPAHGGAHLGRGLARAATGNLEGAVSDFERAAELLPNDAEPVLALGDLMRDLGRVEEAVRLYREAIEREDADSASWLKLGNALTLLEDYEAGASAFREAIVRAPTLAAAQNGLGACLMHLGRSADAITALESAASLDPSDPNPLMNLALLSERSGDLRAARTAWERVLERDPSSSVATQRLARLDASRS